MKKDVFNKENAELFKTLNSKYGGKKILIGSNPDETKEILDYLRLLINANRHLSSYAISTICKLSNELVDCDRRKLRGISTITNYDRIQGGHVDSHGDMSSTVERAVIRSAQEEENIERKYTIYVKPAIKLHNELVKLLLYLKENKYFPVLLISVEKSLPISVSFNESRESTGMHKTDSVHSWYVISESIKNMKGIELTIPKFTNKEVRILTAAKYRGIDAVSIKLYLEKTGRSGQDLDSWNNHAKGDRIYSYLRPWGGYNVSGYEFMHNAMTNQNNYIDNVIAKAYFEMTENDRKEAAR